MLRTLHYPRLVSVETTNRCNAHCTFCPNNASARDKTVMSQDLFEKIIEDCRVFALDTIEPFLQGEPFSDPQILPRLEHIRRRLPRTKIKLYTNGYAMTPGRIDQLRDVGLDKLFVSINTLDPDKYKQTMGLRLERTLRNLDYLTRPHRRPVAREVTFRMTRTPGTTLAEQDQFLDYCEEHGARPFIVGLFNYKGDINSDLPVPGYGCEHINRVDILASGKVTLCCMDHDGEYAWGDVTRQSVLEVYQGRIARRYRQMHRSGQRRQIPPCGACNNFFPDFREPGPLQLARTLAEAGYYFAIHRPTGRRAM